MKTKRKQGMRLYLDTDTYREMLRQVASQETIKTPAEYAAQVLESAIQSRGQTPDSTRPSPT
ncbi:hypothetical protein [Marinobacter qingdaonensis]|uniref:CopG family transcriptional regulator n=1 Tax=Marinobacter qingdaonensis TaxID=3108486 RepID=A0ABU5NY70_9GAMM|nr:hypothetical protein [Marinobacter sp. ASW11-75]MEA1080763.1 hypothetical protein [Marinobacter sp. ASW11-75]